MIELVTSGENREEIYKNLKPQLKELFKDESDMIANLANFAAAIKQCFNFFWVGFYLVKNNELVLGPFQGPIACSRISYGKGVCGRAWELGKALIVSDVNSFPGHISCNSASKSELVIPLVHKDEVWAILDIDHSEIQAFSELDKFYLSELLALIPI